MGIMFENIKRWLVVHATLKPITKTPQDGRAPKALDKERVDKTPSPKSKHASFEIAVTQAKQLFMNQLSRLRHKATEEEHFENDTPGHKESDAVRLLEGSRERDIDEALNAHEQEAKVGQDHGNVTPHTRATPCTTKSVNMRPRDWHHKCHRDPASWNLDEKPKDEALLVTLAFAIDEHFECDKNKKFCVCPTTTVMENAHMEAAGIDISRDLLWDYRSVNARAVLGFMESHWSAMHPKRTQEHCKVPYSEHAELAFSHSWCIACAPIVLQQGLLKLHNEHGVTQFDP